MQTLYDDICLWILVSRLTSLVYFQVIHCKISDVRSTCSLSQTLTGNIHVKAFITSDPASSPSPPCKLQSLCNNQASLCSQIKTVSFNQYCQQISSRRITSSHYNHPQEENKHKDHPQNRRLLASSSSYTLSDSEGLFYLFIFLNYVKFIFWVWRVRS